MNAMTGMTPGLPANPMAAPNLNAAMPAVPGMPAVPAVPAVPAAGVPKMPGAFLETSKAKAVKRSLRATQKEVEATATAGEMTCDCED